MSKSNLSKDQIKQFEKIVADKKKEVATPKDVKTPEKAKLSLKKRRTKYSLVGDPIVCEANFLENCMKAKKRTHSDKNSTTIEEENANKSKNNSAPSSPSCQKLKKLQENIISPAKSSKGGLTGDDIVCNMITQTGKTQQNESITINESLSSNPPTIIHISFDSDTNKLPKSIRRFLLKHKDQFINSLTEEDSDVNPDGDSDEEIFTKMTNTSNSLNQEFKLSDYESKLQNLKKEYNECVGKESEKRLDNDSTPKSFESLPFTLTDLIGPFKPKDPIFLITKENSESGNAVKPVVCISSADIKLDSKKCKRRHDQTEYIEASTASTQTQAKKMSPKISNSNVKSDFEKLKPEECSPSKTVNSADANIDKKDSFKGDSAFSQSQPITLLSDKVVFPEKVSNSVEPSNKMPFSCPSSTYEKDSFSFNMLSSEKDSCKQIENSIKPHEVGENSNKFNFPFVGVTSSSAVLNPFPSSMFLSAGTSSFDYSFPQKTTTSYSTSLDPLPTLGADSKDIPSYSIQTEPISGFNFPISSINNFSSFLQKNQTASQVVVTETNFLQSSSNPIFEFPTTTAVSTAKSDSQSALPPFKDSNPVLNSSDVFQTPFANSFPSLSASHSGLNLYSTDTFFKTSTSSIGDLTSKTLFTANPVQFSTIQPISANNIPVNTTSSTSPFDANLLSGGTPTFGGAIITQSTSFGSFPAPNFITSTVANTTKSSIFTGAPSLSTAASTSSSNFGFLQNSGAPFGSTPTSTSPFGSIPNQISSFPAAPTSITLFGSGPTPITSHHNIPSSSTLIGSNQTPLSSFPPISTSNSTFVSFTNTLSPFPNIPSSNASFSNQFSSFGATSAASSPFGTFTPNSANKNSAQETPNIFNIPSMFGEFDKNVNSKIAPTATGNNLFGNVASQNIPGQSNAVPNNSFMPPKSGFTFGNAFANISPQTTNTSQPFGSGAGTNLTFSSQPPPQPNQLQQSFLDSQGDAVPRTLLKARRTKRPN